MTLPFIALGGIFLIIAVTMKINRTHILNNGVHTDATVIRTERRRSGDYGGYSYYPVLRYTVNAQEYELEYYVGDIQQKYNDGEIIKIVCDKENLKKVQILNDKTQEIVIVVFFFIGLLFFLIGIFSLIGGWA